MKRILLFFIVLIHVAAASTQDTSWPGPSIESKPWTRWWWLGSAVDPPNLSYNLEELARAGMG